jgi:biofilm protein TabA
MIVDKLKNSDLYCFNDSFKTAFKFLKTLDETSEEKRYELGNGIYAVIESYPTKAVSEGRLEAHREYIDIQMVLKENEKIGWQNIDGLDEETQYDSEKDIIFYHPPASLDAFTIIETGTFMLLYPEDGHMPQIQVSSSSLIVKKVVVKIPLDSL